MWTCAIHAAHRLGVALLAREQQRRRPIVQGAQQHRTERGPSQLEEQAHHRRMALPAGRVKWAEAVIARGDVVDLRSREQQVARRLFVALPAGDAQHARPAREMLVV